ncbi:hypothetical protein R4E38_01335 [Morganella morganii]|uniref:hypothetical protein n=1 Tax=Morganella morganii TaxID=582 RepID=UPI001BDAB28B|nr:hypothetical protein [Morganella morganii]MBT0504785.1 hypothetical protein [Morganella morganii subsp. morganii]MDW7785453.1 hypothetical protein [Morganella morganii]QWM12826.1 hypothetical protein IZ182_08530 [Morganella morganii subsp. morganii]
MDIQNIISRLDFSGLNAIEIQKAMNNMEFTADSILSGISSLGNIMFWVSANDDYSDFREDSANIGLMIKQITLIARTLTEQVNDLDCKTRLAPPPSAIKSLINREMKLLVLLAISTTLNYQYSNLKVIYTKTNQRKK